MNALLPLLFWLGALSLLPIPASGQGNRWRTPEPSKQFDLDFRPGQSPGSLSRENSLDRPEDDGASRAYHILGMPLNAFLQAMAQRAGANYIPTPEVQGTVSSVFYDLDPVSMAKAGARVNGYTLDSSDGVFVVHRFSSAGEAEAPPSAFRQKKSGSASLLPSPPPPTKPLKPSTSAPLQEANHPRPSKQRSVASEDRPRSPKKILTARASVSAEDKKLVALAKKLARQKEEQKEILEQEKRLHRRLRDAERALEAERKATEKALREQLARAKKAALEAQRLQAIE